MNEMNENNLSKFEILNGSFPDELSLNNLYLKNTFFTPIKKALCEIVLRKPNDPVEFLGQWLLHYKVYFLLFVFDSSKFFLLKIFNYQGL